MKKQTRTLPRLPLAALLIILLATLLGACGGDAEKKEAASAPVLPPVNPANLVSFTDQDWTAGQIKGQAVIQPAADESDITEYRLYWGQDAATKLATDSAVVDVLAVGAGTSFAGFAKNTPLPAGATHLLVFTANSGGEMETGIAAPISDYIIPPKAYVANSGNNTVSVIDTATDTIEAVINVGLFPVGVAMNSEGTRAYVTNLS
ncbi:MAG: hypothetical protein OEZ59_13765, partial [Deltaproteobacteria bacterium]|nr:hypothetical protein [Deltaproteobacteria bacterium]